MSPSSLRRLLLLLFIAALILLPILPSPEFWITQANYIGLYALVALGLVLLTGVAGLTSFGQAAFVGVGAYTTAYLTTRYGISPWITLPLGLAFTALSAWLIGLITLRMSGHYLPLATIAWSIALFYLFGNTEALNKYDGLTGIPPLNFLGIDLSQGRAIYFLIWGCVLLGVWGLSNLLDSRPGRAIRALKGGVTMAESMGVDTARYKIIVFVIAALLAGVSGWLYAHLQRAVNPTPFGLRMGIEYLFMAVIGGVNQVWGALLGAGLLKVVEDKLQDLLPQLLGASGSFEIIVFGVLMVLILHHARDGLWPYLDRLVPRPPRKPLPPGAPLPVRDRPIPGVPVLEVDRIRKEFGGLVAVNDIGFRVRAGEIVGLIGPNGAGKSTTFNLITGLLPPTSGEVRFLGQRIDGQSSRAIAALGVARTFQHVKLLSTMTVLENVALGAHLRDPVGVLPAALRLDRRDEARLLGEAQRQLARVGLADLMNEQAGNLALGQQRILEVARALACDPVLLLLDEPAAGLRYKEKQALAAVLRQLRAEGMSLLLVEHDMDFVMGLTDHIVVMEFGCRIAEGTPAQIQSDPRVIEAYLGDIE